MTDARRTPAGPPTTPRELFAQILRRLVVVTAAVTVLGALLGLLLRGTPGLWGGLLGGLVGVIFCLTTVVTMQLGEGRSPQFLAVAVLGGWVVKMVVIIAILASLQGRTFYDKVVLAITLVVMVLASLVIETMAVRGARIPVVNPSAGSTPEQ
ncbi:hypothetical protein [Miniimonas sp. S16]|uniref:hypothetical protein n=1 Tax=Miniimonas sp. S16 TaxID=2171623 RepID=UPI000D52814B|nr:hypothetical protein [Miniimonas sp. S16]